MWFQRSFRPLPGAEASPNTSLASQIITSAPGSTRWAAVRTLNTSLLEQAHITIRRARPGIAAGHVHQGAAPLHRRVDGPAHRLALVGDDQHQLAAARAVDNFVHHDGEGEGADHAVKRGVDVAEGGDAQQE